LCSRQIKRSASHQALERLDSPVKYLFLILLLGLLLFLVYQLWLLWFPNY
jgi:hypothetical protein